MNLFICPFTKTSKDPFHLLLLCGFSPSSVFPFLCFLSHIFPLFPFPHHQQNLKDKPVFIPRKNLTPRLLYQASLIVILFFPVMGIQEKQQHPRFGLGLDHMDASKTWVIAGISLSTSALKPILTGSAQSDSDEEECSTTTPTGEEARIHTNLSCPPPAPRKRKPVLKYRYDNIGREFFTPPDLETVFIRKVERAN